MPTFRFRFDPLLRLRQHAEDEVRRRLQAKDAQIAAEEAKQREAERQLEQGLEDKAADLLAGRLDRVMMYAAYFRRLKNAIVWHQDEIGRLREQRHKIVLELAERVRERKIMEKLKEKKHQAFDRAQLALDQKRLDEFANRGQRAEEGF